MAPGRPVKVITVKAPRHNAQRIGTKLGGEIKRISKEQKVRTEIYQPSQEIVQAVESASEWNSLLVQARAERGPQWDVGTQQFLVDKYSDLYYDPTPLQEAVKKQLDEEKGESGEEAKEQPESRPQHPHSAVPPQMHHSNSRHHTPRGDRDFHPHHPMSGSMHDSPVRHHPPNYPYPQTPNAMNMRGPPPPSMGRPPFPGHGGPPPGGPPFNAGPPGQFFGGDSGSPMRMNSMGGGMGMMDHGMGGPMGRPNMGGGGMSPMAMGGMGMGGGGGMGGPMSPMAPMGGGMGMGGMGGMPMNMGRAPSMGEDAFGMH